jgi:hypothetical protein
MDSNKIESKLFLALIVSFFVLMVASLFTKSNTSASTLNVNTPVFDAASQQKVVQNQIPTVVIVGKRLVKLDNAHKIAQDNNMARVVIIGKRPAKSA